MRRTTICRFSSLAIPLAVVLTTAVVPADAQDTLVVQEAQDTVPPPVQDTLLVQGEDPLVHVVRLGETLWSLSEFYLGDALLWPEIYRLNTLVVEDPHWIFPGEELRLGPPDTVLVSGVPAEIVESPEGAERPQEVQQLDPMADAPAPPPPPPPSASAGRTVFARGGRGETNQVSTGRLRRIRALRRGRFYSSGFLTEGENFPWADVLGAVERPTLGTLTASSSAMVYEEIAIEAPRNATYNLGDSLLVARRSHSVPEWGRVIVPTGVVRVTAVQGRNVRGRVILQYGRVTDGQVAMPLEQYRHRAGVPVPIENGVRGSVVAVRDRRPVPNQQQVVFIDVGRSNGIVQGDVFEVLAVRRGDDEVNAEPVDVAVLEIVHVREHSATGLIVQISDLGTELGAPVRLIRKMPL
jgi:hypothetical protein